MISNTKVTTLFSWRDYEDLIRKWLPDAEDLDKDEYEVPLCRCKNSAKLRISRTRKNRQRPFFNCSEYNFRQQCGFFQWVDELLSMALAHEEIKRTADDKASLVQVKLEPLEELEVDHIKKKVEDANVADGMPQQLFSMVKDEPLDQDCNKSDHKDDSACENCCKLKRKMDDDRASWEKEKLELLARAQIAESELDRMKKKAKLDNEGDDTPMFDKLASSENETVIQTITKHANEAVDIPPLDKLANSENETVESGLALDQVETITKHANAVDDIPPLDKSANSDNETV